MTSAHSTCRYPSSLACQDRLPSLCKLCSPYVYEMLIANKLVELQFSSNLHVNIRDHFISFVVGCYNNDKDGVYNTKTGFIPAAFGFMLALQL